MVGFPSSSVGLQSPSDTSTSLGLRIIEGPQAGRIVLLSAKKCSIGSAPHCTLRLRARGIEALQCVIDRTGPESLVYGVTGQTLLNGRPVDRAMLVLGDRLQVGPLQLEVVRDGRTAEPAPHEPIQADAVPIQQVSPTELPAPAETLAPTVENAEPSSPLRAELEARLEGLQHRLSQLGEDLSRHTEQRNDWECLLTEKVKGEVAQAANAWSSDANAQLIQHVTSEVLARMESELDVARDKLHAEISPRLSAQVTHEVADATQHVAAELRQSLASQLSEQLQTQLRAEQAGVTDLVSRQVLQELTAYVNEHLAVTVVPEVSTLASQAATAAVDAGLSATLGERVAEETSRVAIQLEERLTATVLRDVNDRLPGEVRRHVVEEVDQQFARRQAELEEGLTTQITPRVSAEILPQVLQHVASQIDHRNHREVSPELWERFSSEMTERLESSSDQLAREVTDRVRNFLGDQISVQVARHVSAEQASFEAQRTAWEQQQQKSQDEINTHAQHLEQRLEALMRFQRGLDEQHQQWQHDLHALKPELQSRTEQLEQQLKELRQAHAGRDPQDDSWQTEWRLWREEVAARTQQLHDQFSALAQRCEAIEREQQARAAQCDSPANDRADQMDHRLAELRAQREAFEHERHHGSLERTLHPGEHARAIDERLADLSATRHAAPRERQHLWESDDACLQDSHAPEEHRDEPLHRDLPDNLAPETDSTLPSEFSAAPVEPSRMFAHLLHEDDTAPPEESFPASPLEVDRDASGHEEDESIENYMARLMDRVRVMQGTAPTTATPTKSAPPATTMRRESAAVPVEPPAVPEQPKVKDLSEIAPRTMPAELTSNMSAMRDLANFSTRSAIDAHSRKRMRSVVWGKLFVAFMGLACAGALAWMSGSSNPLAYSAALVSTIVAVIWGVEYLMLSGYIMWRRKPTTQDQTAHGNRARS